MMEYAEAVVRLTDAFDEFAHPIDMVFEMSAEYAHLGKSIAARLGLPEPVPPLAQLVAHFGGGRVASIALPQEAAAHDGPERARDVGTLVGGVGRIERPDATDGVGHRTSFEQRPAGEALVEHDAERKDVRSPVELLRFRLLGRHVSELAFDHAALGVAVGIGEARRVPRVHGDAQGAAQVERLLRLDRDLDHVQVREAVRGLRARARERRGEREAGEEPARR